jgi:cell division protein FtsW
MRARATDERWLMPLAATLILAGLVMIYSASAVIAARQYADSFYFLKRQAIWAALGVAALAAVARIDYRRWRPLALPLLGLSAVALALVLVPGIGAQINGSRRWLQLGPLTVQPSEAARLALVIYLADYVARRPERMGAFGRGLAPALTVAGVLLALILAEPDLGSTVVLAAVTLLLLFLGGARWLHLAALALAAVPAVYLLVMRSPYRRERLLAFLDPWRDPTDTGFQVVQSYLAFGSGGPIGTGLGEGRQKLFYLPYPHTDFVFAVIGEELGLFGTVMIVALFGLLAWRGVVIARGAPDAFGRHLALGATLLIAVQAEVNMAVVTGLLPTKGLTLPFLSYGGSSLVVNLVAIGLLWSVARAPGWGVAPVRAQTQPPNVGGARGSRRPRERPAPQLETERVHARVGTGGVAGRVSGRRPPRLQSCSS